MKKLFLSSLLVLVSGCVSVCPLTVNNGTGSGKYRPLDKVVIAANEPVAGTGFDEWQGDISGIGSKDVAKTYIVMDQYRKEITAYYTNAPIPVPAFTNPVCGPNVPGTYSEFFRNKYQYQPDGHAGAQWRCKFAWPSYAVNTLGLTKDNAKTRIYHLDTSDLVLELPIYAIDGGETGQSRRADSEWFSPNTAIPVRIELWINNKLAMRMKFNSVSTQYQGPLNDGIL